MKTWKLGLRPPSLPAALLACLVGVGTASLALAQQYPAKGIEWIVMWSAGGGADTATRTFTKYFEKEIGQNVVVKNVTGGGGSIGYMTSMRTRPDGYHLVTVQGDLAKFTPMQLASIKIQDFDIIGGFAFQSPIIIARVDSPWKTMKDFMEDAKKHPGQRTIGVSDIGGAHHQPVVLWAKAAGLNIRAVAHAGSPQMNAALLGGHVDVIASYIRPAKPYIKEGKLRFLGYFGAKRPEEFPDTPTFKEMGYDVVWEQPYGIGGPAGIADEIKAKLSAATEKVRKNPMFKSDLANLGLEVYDVSGLEFKTSLTKMQDGIAEVIGILKAQK
jgi:tripartite-type tricarboxylate transporter receptor subunit TctC